MPLPRFMKPVRLALALLLPCATAFATAPRPRQQRRTPAAFGDEAARGVRFRPAKVEGRPVAQFITLEYRFEAL